MEFPVDHTIRISHPTSFFAALQTAAAPFRAFGRLLVDLGERSPLMLALTRLQATSDEALQARGLTRHAELHRILGSRYL
jgi:hypothetical protein